jgi:EAL domain-containing protein (putative c-di-GMP-specific phosphodiesterase class I)
VIAEGIETNQELRAATLLGVQGAQGYYIGKPNPTSEWSPSHQQSPTISIPSHPPALPI